MERPTRPSGSGGRIETSWSSPARPSRRARCSEPPLVRGAELRRPRAGIRGTLLQRTAEVDDVAILDDVLLTFESLNVPGLGFLERSGLPEVLEGGDLRSDEALGQVRVDLAGGLDGIRSALEVPAADFGLA